MSKVSFSHRGSAGRGVAMSIVLPVVAVCLAGLPRTGSAQFTDYLKRLRDKAAEKAAGKLIDKRTQAESTLVDKTGQVTDTLLSKGDQAIAHLTGLSFANNATGTPEFAKDLKSKNGVVLRGADFATGSANLGPASDPMLQKLAQALVATPGTYLLEGDTDPMQDPAAAQALSEQRANAVKDRLVSFGVPESSLFTIGYGASRPLNGAPQGSSNDRIELTKMR